MDGTTEVILFRTNEDQTVQAAFVSFAQSTALSRSASANTVKYSDVNQGTEIQFDSAHEAPSNGVLLVDGRRQARRENIELAASKQQINTSSVVLASEMCCRRPNVEDRSCRHAYSG